MRCACWCTCSSASCWGFLVIVALAGKGPADATALLAICLPLLSGTLGLYAYYRGMAVGAISIVAPIAGISAIVPVDFGIATGDRPSAWQLVGIVVALGGVDLVSREPGRCRRGGRRAARAARRTGLRLVLPLRSIAPAPTTRSGQCVFARSTSSIADCGRLVPPHASVASRSSAASSRSGCSTSSRTCLADRVEQQAS